MEKHPMLVTAAIIEKDNKFLITQRPDDGRHNANKWEFPGSKLEFGEQPRECLEREIKEELGIEVKAEDIFAISSHVYGEKHVVLLGFHCKLISGDIQKHDISDFKWVSKEDIGNYDIAEADIKFVEKL